MEQKNTSKSAATCFYLGLLPKTTTRASLIAALSPLGKVLRIRVAREQPDQFCKGYGYAWIEPVFSPTQFARSCLRLPSPVIAFPIQGPKLLGCENTKLLRRFVRVDCINGKITYEDAISYLKSFGSLTFIAREFDKSMPKVTHKVHALFSSPSCITELATIDHHFINGCQVAVFTYVGKQENPFEQSSNSMTQVIYCGLPNFEYEEPDLRQQKNSEILINTPNDGFSQELGPKINSEYGTFYKKSSQHKVIGLSCVSVSKQSEVLPHFSSLAQKADPNSLQNLRVSENPSSSHLRFGYGADFKLCNVAGTLTKGRLQRVGSILKERHQNENLRFNLIL